MVKYLFQEAAVWRTRKAKDQSPGKEDLIYGSSYGNEWIDGWVHKILQTYTVDNQIDQRWGREK